MTGKRSSEAKRKAKSASRATRHREMLGIPELENVNEATNPDAHLQDDEKGDSEPEKNGSTRDSAGNRRAAGRRIPILFARDGGDDPVGHRPRMLQNASIFFNSIGLHIFYFKYNENNSGQKSDLKKKYLDLAQRL